MLVDKVLCDVSHSQSWLTAPKSTWASTQEARKSVRMLRVRMTVSPYRISE